MSTRRNAPDAELDSAIRKYYQSGGIAAVQKACPDKNYSSQKIWHRASKLGIKMDPEVKMSKKEESVADLDEAIHKYYRWGGARVVQKACPGKGYSSQKIWQRAFKLGVKMHRRARLKWDDIDLSKRTPDDA